MFPLYSSHQVIESPYIQWETSHSTSLKWEIPMRNIPFNALSEAPGPHLPPPTSPHLPGPQPSRRWRSPRPLDPGTTWPRPVRRWAETPGTLGKFRPFLVGNGLQTSIKHIIKYRDFCWDTDDFLVVWDLKIRSIICVESYFLACFCEREFGSNGDDKREFFFW